MNASRKMHGFVQEFGYWVKSLDRSFVVTKEPIELDMLLDEVRSFARELLRQRGNSLTIKGSSDIVIEGDRQLLQIILRNLIDNANKYMRNGQITVAVSLRGTVAVIKVSDTGQGFSADKLDEVRTILMNPGNSIRAIRAHKGFGYCFMSDYSKLLDITIQVNNLPSGGASVVLGKFKVLNPAPGGCEKNHDYDADSIGR